MASDDDVVELFVEGARCVSRELRGGDVAAAWESPSILEDQTVASLAGHLARGAVWVVDDYLNPESAPGPLNCHSASEYFRTILDAITAEDHKAIRDRGAAIAAVGHATLVAQLDARLSALAVQLSNTDPATPIAVAGGRVMQLRDYLETRIVEQVVHLDDLDRSLNRGPCDYPAAGRSLCIETGIAIAVDRNGAPAVVRALFRETAASVLPVL